MKLPSFLRRDRRFEAHKAAAVGDLEALERQIAGNCDLAATDADGGSVLHLAVIGGQLAAVRRLLQLPQLCSFLNTRDLLGRTPLHDAVRVARPEIILLLLEQSDLQPDLTDCDGRTALFHFSERRERLSADVLGDLCSRVDPYVRDFRGRTALDCTFLSDSEAAISMLRASRRYGIHKDIFAGIAREYVPGKGFPKRTLIPVLKRPVDKNVETALTQRLDFVMGGEKKAMGRRGPLEHLCRAQPCDVPSTVLEEEVEVAIRWAACTGLDGLLATMLSWALRGHVNVNSPPAAAEHPHTDTIIECIRLARSENRQSTLRLIVREALGVEPDGVVEHQMAAFASEGANARRAAVIELLRYRHLLSRSATFEAVEISSDEEAMLGRRGEEAALDVYGEVIAMGPASDGAGDSDLDKIPQLLKKKWAYMDSIQAELYLKRLLAEAAVNGDHERGQAIAPLMSGAIRSSGTQ